jgi:hypothetical protein
VDHGEFAKINLTQLVTINEAMNDTQHLQSWDDAMAAEYHSLDEKNTGIFSPPPTTDKVIVGMWLLTRKLNKFGKVVCHKARWVVFGNHQEHMIHYFETYSSVARNESLKMMLSMVFNWNLHVFQFDVESAFLYGKIDASIYVAQVLGFEDRDPKKKGWVWRLNKSLYGTKQAPRMWKEHLVESLLGLGFWALILDNALFHNDNFLIFLHMHVDNGLIVGKSRTLILQFIDRLKTIYSLKVNERPKQHLGYTFDWRNDGSLYIHQSDFTQEILDEFDMTDANSVKAPSPLNFQSLVASEANPVNVAYMQKGHWYANLSCPAYQAGHSVHGQCPSTIHIKPKQSASFTSQASFALFMWDFDSWRSLHQRFEVKFFVRLG